MSVVAVITARMGSERLRGKSMMPLAGRSCFSHHAERARRIEGVDAIWLATSERPENDPLAAEAKRLGVEVLRGSEDDVLSRHIAILDRTNAKHLVRVTCDCPLLDFAFGTIMVAKHLEMSADYTFALGVDTGLGIFPEVIAATALRTIAKEFTGESFTLPIKAQPERFRNQALPYPAARLPKHAYRLTVDYDEDYQIMAAIYGALYQPGVPVELSEAYAFLDARPDLAKLNAHRKPKAKNVEFMELDRKYGWTP